MTQYQEAVFTVRLEGEDAKKLSVTEINKLNEELANKGLEKLTKIKRSNGDTEYVTKAALKELERNRSRRKQQEALQQMREGHTEKTRKPNRFIRALKELVK